MQDKLKARITGMGSYLPEKILANKDFEQMVDTNDEWIVSRTGIKERRIAAKDELTSDMGVKAAIKAIKNAKLKPEDIDAVVLATLTPDYTSSSTAAIVEYKLGGKRHVPAFDIQAACSGYLYAFSVAKAYVESGMFKRVLVVASEKMSTFVNYKDRSTCILFGDGASAAVVEGTGKGLAIESITLGSDGELVELLYVPAGGVKNPASEETVRHALHTFKMDGKEVFKHAIRRMGASAKECLKMAGINETEISWLVPHQANMRIMESVAKGFNIPPEKMYCTVQKYGNTSASSIGIALEELCHEHKISTGEHILLVAFGAGFTWAGAVLTKVEN